MYLKSKVFSSYYRNRALEKLLFITCLSGLLLASSSFAHSKKYERETAAPLKVSSFSPNVPVLKNLSANPILRLAVSLPGGTSAVQLRTLQCTVNADALSDIERFDLYVTGAEPFSTQQLLKTLRPDRPSFEIPVEMNIKPGVVFIWISIVLKVEASIRGYVELRCDQVTDAAKINYFVEQGGSEYKKRKGVALRIAGQDGAHTYRIPGIVQTRKGTLIAVYDIRYENSTDLPGNIDVGMSRSSDGGKTWEPMKIIMDMGAPHENNGIGDPAIVYDPDTDKLWVAALWSKGNRSIAGSRPGLSPDTTGQFVLVHSSNDGRTWSAPYTITPEIKEPSWHLFFQGPGSGIVMKDGKLVFAAQYWDEKKIPYSTIIYSDDKGSTWKGRINGPKSNTTESQVVETLPGTLMLNMRDNRGGFRSVATTNDFGSSWTEHATSFNALPDPVCMASIIKGICNISGQKREVLFFSNPNTSSGRYNMTVKASLDLGETWSASHQSIYDERVCFGYSSLTMVDEEHVGVLYEGVRELYFVVIPVSEIIK